MRLLPLARQRKEEMEQQQQKEKRTSKEGASASQRHKITIVLSAAWEVEPYIQG